MAEAVSVQQRERQTARVPKLSYRKAIPADELDSLNQPPRQNVPQARPIARTASTRNPTDGPVTTSSTLVASKKKNSFLSGFFSKEPTISALAQVEADLTAKHGAANPRSVPHVSSRRMPDHVPKVNSKWDGIPETVRLREHEEKNRKRQSQRSIHGPPEHYLRPRSSDESIDNTDARQMRVRRGSDAVSNPASWDSPNESSGRFHRAGSYASTSSSNHSRGSRTDQTSPIRTQVSRQTSATGSSEKSATYSQRKKDATPQLPARQQSIKKVSSDTYAGPKPPIDRIPEHSSSPAATPRELSPATPVYGSSKEIVTRVAPSDLETVGSSISAVPSKRVKHVPIDAFLAGEAQLLELKDDMTDNVRYTGVKARQIQPDSISRGRSGVRPTGVVRSEAAPWELQGSPVPTVSVATRTRVIRK